VIPAFEEAAQRQHDRGTGPVLRSLAQVQDGAASSPRAAGRADPGTCCRCAASQSALRSQPGLTQPLVPGAGAVALLAQPSPFAEVLLEQAFVAASASDSIAVVRSELRVSARATLGPERRAAFPRAAKARGRVRFQLWTHSSRSTSRSKLLALLLQEREATANPVDLVLRGPFLLEGGRGRAPRPDRAPRPLRCQWRRSGQRPSAVCASPRRRRSRVASARRLDRQAVGDAPPRTGSACSGKSLSGSTAQAAGR